MKIIELATTEGTYSSNCSLFEDGADMASIEFDNSKMTDLLAKMVDMKAELGRNVSVDASDLVNVEFYETENGNEVNPSCQREAYVTLSSSGLCEIAFESRFDDSDFWRYCFDVSVDSTSTSEAA